MPAWLIQRLLQLFIIIFQKVTGITGDTRTWTAEGRKQVKEEKAKAKRERREHKEMLAKQQATQKALKESAENNKKNALKALKSCLKKDEIAPNTEDTENNSVFYIVKVKRFDLDAKKYRNPKFDKYSPRRKDIANYSVYKIISYKYCPLDKYVYKGFYDLDIILGLIDESDNDYTLKKFAKFDIENVGRVDKYRVKIFKDIIKAINEEYPHIQKNNLCYVIYRGYHYIDDMDEITFLARVYLND
jgi:hypothetical protein